MILRDARAGDLPAICALQLASWRVSYDGLVPEGYLGAQVERDLTAVWSMLPPPPAFVLVLSEAEGLAGFVTLKFPKGDGPYVDNLHVEPRLKGRGLGRRLMAGAAQRLLGEGFSSLWLTVLEGNLPARRFYAALGGLEGPAFEDSMLGQRVRSCRIDWHDLRPLAPAAPGAPRR